MFPFLYGTLVTMHKTTVGLKWPLMLFTASVVTLDLRYELRDLGLWRELWSYGANRLQDGWTNQAENWWDGPGHGRDHPREIIFWIRQC